MPTEDENDKGPYELPYRLLELERLIRSPGGRVAAAAQATEASPEMDVTAQSIREQMQGSPGGAETCRADQLPPALYSEYTSEDEDDEGFEELGGRIASGHDLDEEWMQRMGHALEKTVAEFMANRGFEEEEEELFQYLMRNDNRSPKSDSPLSARYSKRLYQLAQMDPELGEAWLRRHRLENIYSEEQWAKLVQLCQEHLYRVCAQHPVLRCLQYPFLYSRIAQLQLQSSGFRDPAFHGWPPRREPALARGVHEKQFRGREKILRRPERPRRRPLESPELELEFFLVLHDGLGGGFGALDAFGEGDGMGAELKKEADEGKCKEDEIHVARMIRIEV